MGNDPPPHRVPGRKSHRIRIKNREGICPPIIFYVGDGFPVPAVSGGILHRFWRIRNRQVSGWETRPLHGSAVLSKTCVIPSEPASRGICALSLPERSRKCVDLSTPFHFARDDSCGGYGHTIVGASIARPRILRQKNPSPSGDKTMISLREIQKSFRFLADEQCSPLHSCLFFIIKK